MIVLAGKDPQEAKKEKEASFSAMPLEEHMQQYLAKGWSEKEAMKQVAKDRGVSKRDIYALWKG